MYKRKTFSAATISTRCVNGTKRCLKWEEERTLVLPVPPVTNCCWPFLLAKCCSHFITAPGGGSQYNSCRDGVFTLQQQDKGVEVCLKQPKHRVQTWNAWGGVLCFLSHRGNLNAGLAFPSAPDPKGSPTPLVPHNSVLFSQYPAVISINCSFSFHHLAKIRNSKALNLHWGLFCSNRLQTRAPAHYHMSFLITPNAVIKMKCGTAATFTA